MSAIDQAISVRSPTERRRIAALDGSFSTMGLPPGQYALVMWRFNDLGPWHIGKITLDGRDVTNTNFEVGASDIQNVVITMIDHP